MRLAPPGIVLYTYYAKFEKATVHPYQTYNYIPTAVDIGGWGGYLTHLTYKKPKKYAGLDKLSS